MDREGFRNRLKQYKEAKGFDPQLKYWEWKQKYDSAPQPDNLPSQPEPDKPTTASSQLEDRAHRWDNGYVNTNRESFDSPYEDARYHDYRKPRFEFRKGDVHYGNPKLLNVMGKFGKVLRGGSVIGEVVQNLFPSEEAEAIESLRVNMQKQNDYLTGKDVPKYDEGAEYVERYSTEENPILYKEESAKDKYIRAVNVLKEAGGWSDNLRTELANEYLIPYIPEKEIRLTTGRYNTGKISTNLLDSIYNSAIRTGVPVDIALGLAGRESTLGIGRGFKKGQSVNGTNLMSNWQQIDPDIPTSKDRDKFNDIRGKILFHDDVSDEEYNFSADYIFNDVESRKRLKPLKENPIDNALKFYKSGKYNPGDKKHSQMVEEDAKILMSDPAIKKWAQEKGITYAEGTDGVTGPPTEEQWYADITKYNPTILDNASLQWSIDAAKKALHTRAMELPGYAPMWNNYMRTLPKDDPDINEFVDQLWEYENPDNVGYNSAKKKYYPHKSPEGGKMTIGPGFKLGSGSHNITEREAKRGVTKARLNQEARRSGNNYFKAVDKALNKGQTANPADTVSKQMKYGLADILHQTGSLENWPKLLNAVRNGDLENIKKESIVTWKDSSGKVHEDARRNNLRNENNWHY